MGPWRVMGGGPCDNFLMVGAPPPFCFFGPGFCTLKYPVVYVMSHFPFPSLLASLEPNYPKRYGMKGAA